MKLSQMIIQLRSMQIIYGDLELLDNELFSIRTVAPEIVTAKQADELEMIEGERFARIVSNY